jgi:uroporphyrin-III C-methyltransferase
VSVYLVGAGPGDPGLITVRGLDLIRGCEALVHDRLVAPELVAEAPEDALVVDRSALDQGALNDLLVELGSAGLEVVRLKGGDPFVFGRGGEEALALAEAGIPFEVVPGVSSIAAVPAAADIPVTHRGLADQLTVVTGHRADGSDLDFEALARTRGTVVVFMGLSALDAVAAGLLDAGAEPETPLAIVSRGTLPDQEVVVTTLGEATGAGRRLRGPALIVLGEVVRVRSMLAAAARLAEEVAA